MAMFERLADGLAKSTQLTLLFYFGRALASRPKPRTIRLLRLRNRLALEWAKLALAIPRRSGAASRHYGSQ